jgi:hypothetical protein
MDQEGKKRLDEICFDCNPMDKENEKKAYCTKKQGNVLDVGGQLQPTSQQRLAYVQEKEDVVVAERHWHDLLSCRRGRAETLTRQSRRQLCHLTPEGSSNWVELVFTACLTKTVIRLSDSGSPKTPGNVTHVKAKELRYADSNGTTSLTSRQGLNFLEVLLGDNRELCRDRCESYVVTNSSVFVRISHVLTIQLFLGNGYHQ